MSNPSSNPSAVSRKFDELIDEMGKRDPTFAHTYRAMQMVFDSLLSPHNNGNNEAPLH